MPVLTTLDGFFADRASTAPSDGRASISPGEGIVVAFSGGSDSTALLHGLVLWARDRAVSLYAAHLDHGLDDGSASRARRAARIAAALNVPFIAARRPVSAMRHRGESPEEAARRLRYRFLEQVRVERGARYLATAHHRDDQAETVVLRLLQGTGPAGLAAMEPRKGALVRPLLELSRSQLAGWLRHRTPGPLDDPTNRDLAARRNFVRHRLLPALGSSAPDLHRDLAGLAVTAQCARRALDMRMSTALEPRSLPGGGLAVERGRLEQLPTVLLGPALALLHRRAGAETSPGVGVQRELARQLGVGGAVGCDCGAGWALASIGDRVALRRKTLPPAPFAYTLAVPGRVELPAGNGALRLSRQTARPWMFRQSGRRVGFSLALNAGDRMTVRSRRPGDRIRPFGCSYDRRLKDLLIDRKVPRSERDRLPLLCVGGRVVWVPGVTLDERCRLTAEEKAWVAEWES